MVEVYDEGVFDFLQDGSFRHCVLDLVSGDDLFLAKHFQCIYCVGALFASKIYLSEGSGTQKLQQLEGFKVDFIWTFYVFCCWFCWEGNFLRRTFGWLALLEEEEVLVQEKIFILGVIIQFNCGTWGKGKTILNELWDVFCEVFFGSGNLRKFYIWKKSKDFTIWTRKNPFELCK